MGAAGLGGSVALKWQRFNFGSAVFFCGDFGMGEGLTLTIIVGHDCFTESPGVAGSIELTGQDGFPRKEVFRWVGQRWEDARREAEDTLMRLLWEQPGFGEAF